MSRVKYKPFNLDMNYELETYKHIGKDYGDAKMPIKDCLQISCDL